MVEYIKLKKGLNIPINGIPSSVLKDHIISETIALKPTDFKGLTPKLLVKEGDFVKAGSPVYSDKIHPEVLFTSPVSGIVSEIVRGEKRKLLEIRIKADQVTDYLKFSLDKVENLSRAKITETLLLSGLWPAIKQRPYGIIPSSTSTPKLIYISGFNTAPLASDLDYSLRSEFDNIQVAVNALNKLTYGGIHMGLSAVTHASTPFHKLNNVQFHIFDGPHPAGNVGVQIHHLFPIKKGDVIWTLDIHLLPIIGRLFSKGICDMSRVVAITGPRANNPCYVKGILGMSMKNITPYISPETESYREGCPVRYISGNVLTGKSVSEEGFLGFFDDQITLISEGNYYEMFGWAKPFRLHKFSVSHSYFSWLSPNKRYSMDTNTNGEERAFVMTGNYEKVLPMDIYPVYLLKAILAGNIEKMEQLGIYEVVEEDLALCEYICPSKINVQQIVSEGIEMMIKEM